MKKMKPRSLHIEDYYRYVNDPSTSNLNVRQLNQIIHMHGFMHVQRKHEKVLEAINDEIDHSMLMNPLRSTLHENDDTTLPLNPVPLSMNELIADLDRLQWRDDNDNDAENGFSSMESLHSFSLTNNNVDTQFQIINTCEKRKRKRVRKPKKVFNPVYMTKPRSKKNVQKRKSLADIIIAAN